MAKKPKLVIAQTLITDGKIILSKEELVSLIRLRYPEFPIGNCRVDSTYGSCDYAANDLGEIIVQSIKSENYES